MPKTTSTAKIPRLAIRITPWQYAKLRQHIEWGLTDKVFSAVVDDIISMCEVYGQHFIIAMLQRKISYEGLMEDYMERNKN